MTTLVNARSVGEKLDADRFGSFDPHEPPVRMSSTTAASACSLVSRSRIRRNLAWAGG